MVCEGKLSREIETALGLGRRTIENRRASVMAKMGVLNVAQLVRRIHEVGPYLPLDDE